LLSHPQRTETSRFCTGRDGFSAALGSPLVSPPPSARKLGLRLVWRQQAHLDGFLLGHWMSHRCIKSLTWREQRSDRSCRGTWAVRVAGTDRISSEADNHCTNQNTSNDIIAFHGGDPRSPPPQQPSAPSLVPFRKPAGESGADIASISKIVNWAEAEASPDIHIVGFSALGLGLRPIMPLAFDVAAHLLVVVKAPSAIARRAVECNDGGEREPGGACGYEKNHGTRSTHQLRRREHRNVSDFALMLLCVHPPRSVIQGKKKPPLG
jgi:hypothetical protein